MATLTAVHRDIDLHRDMTDTLWKRLTRRLVADLDERGTHISLAQAEETMNETLCHLRDIALDPDGTHVPSRSQDWGWHVFLQFNGHYNRYCTQTFGRIILHEPNDDPAAGAPPCKNGNPAGPEEGDGWA